MVKALKSETWQDLINCLNSSLDMTLFLANLICNSFVIATVLAATTEDFHQSGSFFTKWFTCFWQSVIANKPPIMQIFPFSKFELISSDYWFKSHGQKVNFQSRNSYLFGLKFSASGQIEAEILSGQICQTGGLFAKAVCSEKVIHLSEKISTFVRILCIKQCTLEQINDWIQVECTWILRVPAMKMGSSRALKWAPLHMSVG